jgi:glucose-1-phosphate cytidylyltransferase
MKTVILCGGLGTRLAEETTVKPKPMVQIGGRPILWHIMNIYGHYGASDFVLALGYKGEVIKEYFLNYYALNSDLKIDLASGELTYQRRCPRNWKVELLDTGEKTMTGGRLLRLKPTLADHGTFMLTYGDGVADLNIDELLKFHRSHKKAVTVTAVRPTARFGGMEISGINVTKFREKPQSGEGWINGGFFVMEPRVFDYLDNDATVLETLPMEKLVNAGEIAAFPHSGFWQCMDTIRERTLLEEKWNSGRPDWKVWED